MALYDDAPNIFFTADPHFYHALMVELRGFATDIEMNEALIANWNATVGPDARTYCLGDFSLGDIYGTQAIIKRLNGQICLISGNHESVAERCEGFVWIRDVKMLRIRYQCDLSIDGKVRIFLSHYAHRVWPRSHHGTMHLYGHSHGDLPENLQSRSMDVGLDACNLRPISLAEVLTIMRTRNWVDLQMHRRNVD